MGICAIRGPAVLHEEPDDGELSPRSTTSSASSGSNSSSSGSRGGAYRSASSPPELDLSSPVWQRTIPKGRRCKPLSFSGMIIYDENGKQVELSLEGLEEDEDDDEYFSPQPSLGVRREPGFEIPATEI